MRTTYSNRPGMSAQQNAMREDIGEHRIYYSYNTIVAFIACNKLYISKNRWSRKTGEHLNLINPDKSIRLNQEEFEKQAKKHGVRL